MSLGETPDQGPMAGRAGYVGQRPRRRLPGSCCAQCQSAYQDRRGQRARSATTAAAAAAARPLLVRYTRANAFYTILYYCRLPPRTTVSFYFLFCFFPAPRKPITIHSVLELSNSSVGGGAEKDGSVE